MKKIALLVLITGLIQTVNAQNPWKKAIDSKSEQQVLSIANPRENANKMIEVDGSLMSPLAYACLYSNSVAVAKLLEYGADMTNNPDGHNPVKIAARVGCVECLQSLFNSGASAAGDGSISPLELAKRGKHEKAVALIEKQLKAETK